MNQLIAEQPGPSKDIEASMETCYEEASHPQYVLSLLEKDSKYCNITLEAEGEKIKVHESVFGTYSDFFDKAFSAEMCEKYQKKVKLEGISAGVLRSIVDFLYTGKVSISLENAFELLAAADYLMIDKIKHFSETFLTGNINASNWKDMWHNAEKYRLPELTKSTAIYIGKNLKTIMDENGLDIFSVTELKHITKKSKTFRESEEQTFEVIIAWVKKNRKRGISLLDGLFCNLDLCQFTPETLKTVVLGEELVRNSALIMSLVADELLARNDKLIEEKHQLQLQLNSTVATDDLLAIEENNTVHMFDISRKAWKTLCQCPAEFRNRSGDYFRYLGSGSGLHMIERQMINGVKIISSVPDTSRSSSFKRQKVEISQNGFIFAEVKGITCALEKGTRSKCVYGYERDTNKWIQLNWDGHNRNNIVSIVQTH